MSNQSQTVRFNRYVERQRQLSLAYLLYAYDIDATTFKRLRQRDGAPLKKQVAHNKGKSVVVNQEYAESIYTPCYFFVKSQMRKWLENNQQATQQCKADRRKCVRNLSSVTNYTNSIYEQFYCRTYCTVNKTRYTVDSGEKEKGKTIVS